MHSLYNYTGYNINKLSLQETGYQYWPMSGMVQFGEYAIDLMEERAVTGFTIRKISIYDVKV